MNDLSQYIDIYLEELDEQLNAVEEEMLRLEQEGSTESGIQRLFRAAHTLKGSSAAMGFAKMNELTHEMEHLLDLARNGQLSFATPMTDLFFRCLDGMKKLQAEIVRSGQEQFDIGPLILQLREYTKRNRPVAEADSFDAAPPEAWRNLQLNAVHGRLAVKLRVSLADTCEMKAVRAYMVDVQVRELGYVAWSNLTDPEPNGDDPGSFVWLAAIAVQADELEERIAGMMDVENAAVEMCDLASVGFEAEAHAREPGGNGEEPAESTSAADRSRSQTVRVQVDRLEHLMNLVGELVIDQTRMQQLQKLFRQQLGSDDHVDALSALSDHLTRTVGELQQSVMKVRMLPLEHLFNRFPRMVRDTARTLQKDVEFVVEGKDAELDRTIIEDLGDPLTHLIRNALDHGLEAPVDRIQAGKPAKGTLRISAIHEDNQVVITVEDDGAGIRAERIRQSAVAKGIIAAADAAKLMDAEAVHLIFRPGFSTASTVSEISGRGVGMDIVRTEIERLNGTIEIDTVPGQGTRFVIRLPLTLAIITGLLVQVSEKEFILPMSSVAEIIRTEASEIRTVNGNPVVKIRDQIVPIVWLHDALRLPRGEARRKQIPLVIVGRMEKRLALAVDDLLGNQEVVIKSLGTFIGQADGVSGATILGNGKVAMILDTTSILKWVEAL
ncbi:chemotaxis protein CheA [Cohnella lubricantis]|uniref:Chemotaxis protein CheA n=1 Tax=Cohnella lubricantis TaxID=2163172 RepID=A0A841T5B3_9BACL|nr:chemotaxis protein CheA [Cohnella lubricantis]MBB6676052.1 chemotaxis protein CheA [Cohnella lubricantis]MBP2118007.1 two-component system chemotaxis sensor kinase CheA [Cohnella lubricantis]